MSRAYLLALVLFIGLFGQGCSNPTEADAEVGERLEIEEKPGEVFDWEQLYGSWEFVYWRDFNGVRYRPEVPIQLLIRKGADSDTTHFMSGDRLLEKMPFTKLEREEEHVIRYNRCWPESYPTCQKRKTDWTVAFAGLDTLVLDGSEFFARIK